MQGPFLNKIAVLDHLLDVVRNIRPEIVASRRQFADGEIVVADIVQDQALNVVDIVDTSPFQLGLD